MVMAGNAVALPDSQKLCSHRHIRRVKVEQHHALLLGTDVAKPKAKKLLLHTVLQELSHVQPQ